MKLVHRQYGFNIEFKENRIQKLVIENPRVLSNVIMDLKNQCQGMEGEFILSKNNEPILLKKSISLVLEPFSLDCNNKRILSKMYQILEKQEQNYPCELRAKFNQSLMNYLDYICMQADMSLTYDEEFELQDIFKLAKVRVESDTESLLKRIVTQICLEQQVLEQNIFVFLNLKSFLTEEEVKALYYECFYKKIYLLLIECSYSEKMDEEDVCIIDKDLCIIYL